MKDVSEVKGVGPRIEKKLKDVGIDTVDALANADVEKLVEAGIGKTTATRIIKNAISHIETSTSSTETQQTTPVEKPAKKKKKLRADERSPMPQGVPTRKKRGSQIRAVKDDDDTPKQVVKKVDGWNVKGRELTAEEKAKKKKRQEELAKASKITRPIPKHPKPVKAKKTETKQKSERPVKKEKDKKDIVLKEKKVKEVIEYYTVDDLIKTERHTKFKVKGKSSGDKKPRISLEKDTKLGVISSFRRSKRVIHERQLIVDLDDNFSSDSIVGKKIYFVYPDTNKKVAGSIGKRFGKSSSKKVLLYFKSGIRREAINQPVFVK